MELLTHGGEHHEIGDGGWLMMTMATDSPSPEPRTDSRSALPRGFRAWRRLRIVKHDESFSLIFFLLQSKYIELELRSVEQQGAHEAGGRAPHPRGQVVGPLALILLPVFLIFYKNKFRGVSGHSENFCFCT